jgi:hypothetical protein
MIGTSVYLIQISGRWGDGDVRRFRESAP